MAGRDRAKLESIKRGLVELNPAVEVSSGRREGGGWGSIIMHAALQRHPSSTQAGSQPPYDAHARAPHAPPRPLQPPKQAVPVIVADAFDYPALASMAQSTAVVINVAGPCECWQSPSFAAGAAPGWGCSGVGRRCAPRGLQRKLQQSNMRPWQHRKPTSSAPTTPPPLSPPKCPPDAKYGDKVVEAAVNEGAHYCDITGGFVSGGIEPAWTCVAFGRRQESLLAARGPPPAPPVHLSDPPPNPHHPAQTQGEINWVQRMIGRHHAAAEAKGVKVVNCCGFDSVPFDIGALVVVDHIRRELGK
jgi:hypothetical protein